MPLRRLLFTLVVSFAYLLSPTVFAAAGDLDASFDPSGSCCAYIDATAVQADGKVVIGGQFSSYNNAPITNITRANSDGSIDVGFDPGSLAAGSYVLDLAVQSDGKIVIVGRGSSSDNYVKRLNADGSLDSSFSTGGGPNDQVNTVSLQNDGKIIIGGDFTAYDGVNRRGVARLNSNGSLDHSFSVGSGINQDSSVLASEIQEDGKILIGGSFTTYNGFAASKIARLNANGSLDTGFNSSVGGIWVYDISAQSDGKIVIVGYFPSNIARLNADGSLDAGFNVGTGANDIVYTVTSQVDGKVIIGGSFTSFNGTARNHIARLNANGALDSEFSPSGGASDLVLTSTLQADGKVIIGGKFGFYAGVSRMQIARVHTGSDIDSDGIEEGADVFPNDPAEWRDTDNDGIGDNADSDDDADGVVDVADNCQFEANSDQQNVDGDSFGDVCDIDDDNDGVVDASDNCPLNANPDQFDSNGNGVGDVCDGPVLPPYSFFGAEKGSNSGASVAFAGDVNDDGFGDYIVGIPKYDVPATQSAKEIKDAGRAEVISGKDGSALMFVNGVAAKDAMGTAVAGAADVNNDGFDDVLIGAPNADDTVYGLVDAGSVTVLYGPYGIDRQTLFGNQKKAQAGSSVALGDVNKDGFADIVYGAPKHDDELRSLVDAGSVTVLSGDGYDPLGVFLVATAKANAGTSVAVGDLDGDGAADIIIGAPNDDDLSLGLKNAGTVTAYTINRDELLREYGAVANAYFGKSVASGDINKDGFTDVLVGAIGDDLPATDSAKKMLDAGSVTVFFSNNAGLPLKKYGAVAKAGLGGSVAAGDVNDDGYADIIAGASKDDKPDTKVIKDAGSVSVWSGDGYSLIGSTLYGAVSKDHFGAAVSAGRITGDDKVDLIIGIPGFDLPATLNTKIIKDAGAVHVVSGTAL